MKDKVRTGMISACLLCAVLLLGSPAVAAEDPPDPQLAFEADLDPAGEAYEMHLDSEGSLWISDYGAEALWQVDPLEGTYARYDLLTGVLDAQRDANGDVWWAEADGTRLGRLSPSTGEVTTWAFGDAQGLWGIAFDGEGNVWISEVEGIDENEKYNLYRLDPTDNEACRYNPDVISWRFSYLLYHDGYIWFGDRNPLQPRIYRLAPDAEEFEVWQLPIGSIPLGLTFDDQGSLWWSDLLGGELGRLKPGEDMLTRFDLPAGATPDMIAPEGSRIWYTDSTAGVVGRLDPSLAFGADVGLGYGTIPVTPDCTNLTPSAPWQAAVTTGSLTWADHSYHLASNGGGITAYQLPVDAAPYGIVVVGEEVWVVDQGRQKLLRLTMDPVEDPPDPPPTQEPPDSPEKVFLPLLVRR